jgi:hypothetical protein
VNLLVLAQQVDASSGHDSFSRFRLSILTAFTQAFPSGKESTEEAELIARSLHVRGIADIADHRARGFNIVPLEFQLGGVDYWFDNAGGQCEDQLVYLDGFISVLSRPAAAAMIMAVDVWATIFVYGLQRM